MKLTMAVTLEGLIRALRWKEHALAERIERGHARGGVPPRSVPRKAGPAEGGDDDRRNR